MAFSGVVPMEDAWKGQNWFISIDILH